MNRPPKEDRSTIKSKQLLILVKPHQHTKYKEAAKRQGFASLADWVRTNLDRVARM